MEDWFPYEEGAVVALHACQQQRVEWAHAYRQASNAVPDVAADSSVGYSPYRVSFLSYLTSGQRAETLPPFVLGRDRLTDHELEPLAAALDAGPTGPSVHRRGERRARSPSHTTHDQCRRTLDGAIRALSAGQARSSLPTGREDWSASWSRRPPGPAMPADSMGPPMPPFRAGHPIATSPPNGRAGSTRRYAAEVRIDGQTTAILAIDGVESPWESTPKCWPGSSPLSFRPRCSSIGSACNEYWKSALTRFRRSESSSTPSRSISG